MQDVHNILLCCNTDVVIIKPVTGRASICSASLKTTRRLIALSFHKELSTFTFQWSSSSSHNTRNILVCQDKCIELYCTMSYCNIATYWYIVTALLQRDLNHGIFCQVKIPATQYLYLFLQKVALVEFSSLHLPCYFLRCGGSRGMCYHWLQASQYL